MIKDVVLTSKDVLDYHAFVLFGSRRARNQHFFNTLGVFAEAMIAGFIVDKLANTQYYTIAGIIFGVIWLFAYPVFLKRKRLNALRKIKGEDSQKSMKFAVNDEYFAFYESEISDKEKFEFDRVSEIYELKNIFVIFLHDKIHIIIPKDDESAELIKKIAKNTKKPIARYEKLDYESVFLA
ncbi:hypothetical protein CCAL9344_01800 [Campylobacter sp. RM9344]|uniref:YcxB-like protein domain-containing protein n=1 Tax=Campylobacter californiensis TaxID=1032243 RepID=A0AAW3ZRB1_9BACT|nr:MULTISPECIES: hypothetical protein [unclassified Campylobacter]MBE2984493.1 hypothetical protein [Campylobacter sp. RM6883]MBE2985833.1 hypothetical protein [Campylobacter sp. RM12919]MBE2987948.1 hypothetical protein [Campylobacter sp. RM12920]MBE2994977.1 hypothetical protein [Campylobacter sp. RM6913]MBE3028934.1 hypothetical protein [Campylobacter sp. RM9344]